MTDRNEKELLIHLKMKCLQSENRDYKTKSQLLREMVKEVSKLKEMKSPNQEKIWKYVDKQNEKFLDSVRRWYPEYILNGKSEEKQDDFFNYLKNKSEDDLSIDQLSLFETLVIVMILKHQKMRFENKIFFRIGINPQRTDNSSVCFNDEIKMHELKNVLEAEQYMFEEVENYGFEIQEIKIEEKNSLCLTFQIHVEKMASCPAYCATNSG